MMTDKQILTNAKMILDQHEGLSDDEVVQVLRRLVLTNMTSYLIISDDADEVRENNYESATKEALDLAEDKEDVDVQIFTRVACVESETSYHLRPVFECT